MGDSIKIYIYIDRDTNRIVSEGDILVDSVFTDTNGDYNWTTAANVDFVLGVDIRTIPPFVDNSSNPPFMGRYVATDDEKEVAELGSYFGGKNLINKDFGFNDPRTLPVELVAFDAKYESRDALLTWTTTSEINSHYYEVQRSLEGRTFEEIGRVDAAGNSSVTLNYDYTDKAVHLLGKDKLYYRLRQVDFDGAWAYSPIVELDIPPSDLGLNIYPNPVSTTLFIQNSQPSGQDIEILLIDMRGKEIKSGFLAPAQKMEWDMSYLARSVYYLRAKQGEVLSHHKIVVE